MDTRFTKLVDHIQELYRELVQTSLEIDDKSKTTVERSIESRIFLLESLLHYSKYIKDKK